MLFEISKSSHCYFLFIGTLYCGEEITVPKINALFTQVSSKHVLQHTIAKLVVVFGGIQMQLHTFKREVSRLL